MSNFKMISFDECKQMSRRLIAMNPNRNANMGQIATYLLDYYTELTKQPWLCTLVGQIRDLTAKQNLMLQQAAEAVDAAQYQNEDDDAFDDDKLTEESYRTTFEDPENLGLDDATDVADDDDY